MTRREARRRGAGSRAPSDAGRTPERPEGAGAPAAPWTRVDALVVALLALAVAAVFAPLARAGFVAYDDGLFVFDNPHVRAGLSSEGLRWAFANWEHRIWGPLTWLSHMLDAQLFGVDGVLLGLPAAGWHHLSSVALHAAAAALLFGFLRAATGTRWPSALVAALFALHPLHVESVAWVSERKSVLSTALGFACLWAYASYARRPGRARYLLVAALLAAGLMAKSMLVTWPFLLLALDLWPLRRWAPGDGGRALGRLALEKLPLFGLALALCVVTFLAQRPAMALMDAVPLATRAQNALVAVLDYAAKAVWPRGLAVHYPYRAALPAGQVLGGAGLVLAALGLAWRQRGRRPWLTVGALWFLGTLVPVSGLVQVGNHAAADRYTYVPLVGAFLALAWSGAELARRARGSRPALFVAAGAALVACGLLARAQTRHWSDTVALFRHATAIVADDGFAHAALGKALAREGRHEEAERELRAALALLPRYADARESLGEVLAEQGDLEGALSAWRAALRDDPRRASAFNRIGAATMLAGRPEEAEQAFRAALRLAPDDALAHNNLASLLAHTGRLPQAAAEYRAALALAPELAAARANLARCLAADGRDAQAARELAEAVRRAPADPQVARAVAELLPSLSSAPPEEVVGALERLAAGGVGPAGAPRPASSR